MSELRCVSCAAKIYIQPKVPRRPLGQLLHDRKTKRFFRPIRILCPEGAMEMPHDPKKLYRRLAPSAARLTRQH